GALYMPSGSVRFTSSANPVQNLTIDSVSTVDGSSLFPTLGANTIGGSAINVALNASLNISAIVGGGGDLVKMGAGQLEFSGTEVSTTGGNITPTYGGALRVKSGTLLLNRSAGIASTTSNTVVVGDDVSGNTATLRLGASN